MSNAALSMKKGKAIIFSAPSGSGKTTIVKHLLATNDHLAFSISACTRDKRGRSEKHGKDYYFFTPKEFMEKIQQDRFVEWQEVYAGAFYGTLKSEVQRLWDEGKTVLFDVDVKGGVNLKKYFGEDGLAVFVKPPSEEELKKRLVGRGTEDEDSLSKRLFKAKFELQFQNKFDVVLENNDLIEAFRNAQQLVDDFLG